MGCVKLNTDAAILGLWWVEAQWFGVHTGLWWRRIKVGGDALDGEARALLFGLEVLKLVPGSSVRVETDVLGLVQRLKYSCMDASYFGVLLANINYYMSLFSSCMVSHAREFGRSPIAQAELDLN
ncbi:LOW QUALITY PROTEIN: hypothetical protein V2J09_020895 [Rumex salicifolius]